MFESVREGFLGFFLVLSSWFSVSQGDAELMVRAVQCSDTTCAVVCAADLGWNEQMTQLVDAGIPVRFRIGITTDAADTIVFIRALQYDVADDAYRFVDSSVVASRDTVAQSKDYPQILIALRDVRRWTFLVSSRARIGHIEVSLLRSHVSRLNRTVDMTQVWGRKKLSTDFRMESRQRKRRQDDR